MAVATKQQIRFLAPVDGGLNYRYGQVALKKNQTRKMRNWDLDLSGGLKKVPGFTKLITLPSHVQDFILYRNNDRTYQLLAYHYPFISRLDTQNGSYSVLRNLVNEGDPDYCQYQSTMHVVDGANGPITYNGNSFSTVTWPPSYTGTNSSQLTSVYARSSNPTTATNPKACAIHANRAWYINDEVGRVFASVAGTTTDFSTNAGALVPIDIAFFVDFPVTTPFTAIKAITNGLILYEQDGFSRITGENAPIVGLSNTFEFKRINSFLGALHQKMVAIKDDNDHFFYSRYGLYTLALSENFDQTKPGGLTYYIQPELDTIGLGGMSRSRLVNAPNDGKLYMVTPRKRVYEHRNKIWKLNYGLNPYSQAWSIAEYFGDFARLDAMISVPPTNDIFIAIYNEIYQLTGTGYYNSSAIQSEYEFAPEDFDAPGINKQISAYYLLYTSTTGGTLWLDHGWDNDQSGRTEIAFTARTDATAGTAILGTSTLAGGASFLSNALRIPISGACVGKSLIVKPIHNSSTEDLTIYGIGIEYNLWGIGG